MYLEDNSWELAENYSPRNLAFKPIQKIIYLYNNFLENISEISDLVDLSSHYVPTPQDAISIISKNSKWEDVVSIANTTIIQYLDEVLPDNVNKFIIIPDVNNKGLLVEYSKEWADWQDLENAQIENCQNNKISCVPIEALYLHLCLLIEESRESYNKNNKLLCTNNVDTKVDLPCDNKVDLLSDLDGYTEDYYLQ
ncbi:hypothetical protein [Cardinium endosymbiont of Nabis limbatus]|uniref:hypothetical protein n=1 Tax=Cardinium endosymbiont of Nabis limbatus TaxID=3066217 RepID=UPI003AF3C9DE